MQTAKKGFSGLEFAAGIPASVGGAVFMNAGAQGSETEKTLVQVEFVRPDGTLITFKKSDLQFSYRFSSFQNMEGAIVSALFELTPSIDARTKQRELLDYRIRTQPYHEKSAGCVFRNPAGGSAGALIDRCGLKGARIGDAAVSSMHANFFVNKGVSSCKDMQALIHHVRDEVKAKEGIELEQEVREIPSHA
jgi:UDP-N-acetylmuramate dehydrogenase